MQIEPDTKIVQTHFGGQTSLKPGQVMRTFTSQTKGIQEFVVDRFNDLSDAGQPAPQRFGPALPFAALMRRGDQISLSLLFPSASWSLAGEAFIRHIRALGWQARDFPDVGLGSGELQTRSRPTADHGYWLGQSQSR